jgi:hypothetical protein
MARRVGGESTRPWITTGMTLDPIERPLDSFREHLKVVHRI